MKPMHIVSLTLVIIGALNWGLVGLFGYNLVAAIFGEMSAVTRFVYILVGFAGVYEIFAARSFASTRSSRTTTV